ncbi:MAG: DUF1559 domain-containing protein [Rubripirellula sp.]
MLSPKLLQFALIWIATLLTPYVVMAQGLSDPGAFIPPSAVFAARVNVPVALEAPMMEMAPVEIASAWFQQNLGIELSSLEELKLVVGMPAGPGPPPFGAVARLTEDFDVEKINRKLFGKITPRDANGRDVHVLTLGSDQMVLDVIEDRTVVLASPPMHAAMLSSDAGDGPLASLLAENPMGDRAAQLIAAVEPAREMLLSVGAAYSEKMPPQLQEMVRIPELLDAAVLKVSLDESSALNLSLLTDNEATASELANILVNGIAFGKEMAIAKSESEMLGEGPMADAQRAYTRRISTQIAEMMTPKQVGSSLEIETMQGGSVATTGVLVGLLLPAVQAAREAARRMSASNNLKQVGLAFHNHHSAYKKLPAATITDEQGNPLLSWRVALLPFLGEQELYDQFRLDEPWDSPHNIQFSKLDLPFFQDPSLPLPPGMTVFHALIGDGYALNSDGETKFREFLDGLSNTILVVEADASQAVPWTSPERLELDVQDPLSQMGHIHQGGFHVLMADGAVIFITHAIDEDLFRALLTKAGKEALQP